MKNVELWYAFEVKLLPAFKRLPSIGLCTPLGSHKAKTYSRYTKVKGKESEHTPIENHQIKKISKKARKEERNYKTIKTINNMATGSPNFSITSFNVNGLNSSVKRQSG